MPATTTPPKCNLPWTLPATYVAGQFHHLHRFIVVNARTMVAVEGHYSQTAASRACSVLAAHNQRSGNPDTYEIHPLPQPLHNWGPSHWH